MKDLQQKLFVFTVVLIIFSFFSCYSTRYNLPGFNKNIDYPEGVDSLVVAKSDSIIKYLFVDFTSKQKAGKLAKEAQVALIHADSIWQKLKSIRVDSTRQNFSVDSDSNSSVIVESTALLKKIKENLQIAERNFLHSIKLNPFPLNTKDGLVQTYMLWADIERPDFYYEKALAVLKDVINYEKGEHLIFYKLGECYFQLRRWDQALSSYRQAEKILLSTTFYTDSILLEAPPNDSIKKDLHFNYLYSQAVCLARMYKAKEALLVIKKAGDLAPSSKRKKIADRFEEWLNWDNGNIHAAEEKNQILALINKEKYAESVSRFEELKNQLSDRFAIDEIDWRIAGLEFKYLNEKQYACNRLLKIIKKNEKSSYYPPHLIATYEKYVTDCGLMHYHLGMDYIQKAKYKQAQKYLEQGAKLNWYGNYKCQLELAKLNKHDPQASLEIIEKVLQGQTALTIPERITALEIKLSALRKLGPRYLNETKQIYQEIRELQRK